MAIPRLWCLVVIGGGPGSLGLFLCSCCNERLIAELAVSLRQCFIERHTPGNIRVRGLESETLVSSLVVLNCQDCCVLCPCNRIILLKDRFSCPCIADINRHILNVLSLFSRVTVIATGVKVDLLIARFQYDILLVAPSSIYSVFLGLILEHVFLDSLGHPHSVSAAWLNKVSQVWDEVSFCSLLLSECIWVYVPELAQVVIECWLARQLANINFFGPEWVLPQMFPRDALDRIFLE